MRNGGIKYILPALTLALALSCGGGDNKPIDRYGEIGDPCTSDVRCAGDLICAHDGTCQELREGDEYGDSDEGESCTTTDDCSYGVRHIAACMERIGKFIVDRYLAE